MKENNQLITTKDELTESLLYTAPDGEIKVEAFLHDENIWLTQKKEYPSFSGLLNQLLASI